MTNDNDAGSLRFGPRVLRQIMQSLEEEPGSVITLQVSDGPDEKVVYFSGGGIRLLSVGERSGVGIESCLLGEGLVDIEALHEVLEKVRIQNKQISEVLVENQIVSREEYQQIVRKLIRDEILDLAEATWRTPFGGGCLLTFG